MGEKWSAEGEKGSGGKERYPPEEVGGGGRAVRYFNEEPYRNRRILYQLITLKVLATRVGNRRKGVPCGQRTESSSNTGATRKLNFPKRVDDVEEGHKKEKRKLISRKE